MERYRGQELEERMVRVLTKHTPAMSSSRTSSTFRHKFFQASLHAPNKPRKQLPYHLAEPIDEQIHREAQALEWADRVERRVVTAQTGMLAKRLVGEAELKDVGRRVEEMRGMLRNARVRAGSQTEEEARTPVTDAIHAFRNGNSNKTKWRGSENSNDTSTRSRDAKQPRPSSRS
jgi:hypothetical protein